MLHDIVIGLLWRIVLLIVAAHAVYVSAYEHGVRDTESFYEDDGWEEDPEGSTST